MAAGKEYMNCSKILIKPEPLKKSSVHCAHVISCGNTSIVSFLLVLTLFGGHRMVQISHEFACFWHIKCSCTNLVVRVGLYSICDRKEVLTVLYYNKSGPYNSNSFAVYLQ